MRIHHNTQKRAEQNGVALALHNDGVRAEKGKSIVFHTDAKEALSWVLIAETLRAEYPALAVVSTDQEGDATAPYTCAVFHGASQTWLDFDPAPTMAEVQERCEAEGIDPEEQAPEDEEEGRAGSVVPHKYRLQYKERGNPTHCGDFLASLLHGQFQNQDGEFEHGAFEAFLRENDVPVEGKWTELPRSGSRGWQGRYRMCGRAALDKRVARRGVVVLGGVEHTIPEPDLTTLREKHKAWIAKQDKAEAKAVEPEQQAA